MIVPTNFNDDLVFVLVKQVKVDVVWISEPHRVVIGTRTSVHMLNDDELAPWFSSFKLLFEPKHLLDTRSRAVALVTHAIIVECIDRDD